MIWLTADPHLAHNNIIKYCNRPFENIKQHDETLIANWNAVVQPKDDVYLLGDTGFASPVFLEMIYKKLNGKIYLIRGNHDKSVDREPLKSRFEWIKDVHMLKTQHKGEKIEIFLSHYSHQSWPKSHHGVPHAFGHSHGKVRGIGRSIDVGVDCWNYFPISIQQFLDAIEQKIENERPKVTPLDPEEWKLCEEEMEPVPD